MWRRSRIVLTVILFVTTCWTLFHSYSFYTLYQSATQPFALTPTTPSRLEESCHGTFVTPKNVAIIGAGAAGASTAYHLRRFASPCQPLNVTVFERRHYVGGRSTTVHIYDRPEHPVELGASIFVAVNHILVQTAAELGLRTKDDASNDKQLPIPPSAAGTELGVWDGSVFRFVLPRDEPTWRLAARLLWQYGTSPLRVQALMRQTVDRFLSLYEEPLFPFASLSDAAVQADLLETTGVTGAKYMAGHGVGEPYAADIVQASTRVNYAQDITQIHALEAMVCMAAEGGARSIQGGNWRIFAGMIAANGAHLRLETSVESATRTVGGEFVLRTNTSREDLHFDAVVLAAPWEQAGLRISPQPASTPDKVEYVSLHVTLFASPFRLRPGFFHLPDNEAPPRTILTTRPRGDETLPFFSISLLRAINNTHSTPPRTEFAYKIFSPAPLSKEFLFDLLDLPVDKLPEGSHEAISWSHHKVWDAYPYLPPRTTFDGPEMPFEDGNGAFYYTSGIEPFISTMETSALMGRNVAKLLAERFERDAAREGTSQLRVQGGGRGVGEMEMKMEL